MLVMGVFTYFSVFAVSFYLFLSLNCEFVFVFMFVLYLCLILYLCLEHVCRNLNIAHNQKFRINAVFVLVMGKIHEP